MDAMDQTRRSFNGSNFTLGSSWEPVWEFPKLACSCWDGGTGPIE